MIKNYFVFQKVYWFSEEWKDFLDFLSKEKVQFSLLSKKSFLYELQTLKKYFTGECFVIYLESSDFYFFHNFLKKIKKWEPKIFWIGVFSCFDGKKWIFFQKEQFLNFLNYFFWKKNNQNNNIIFSLYSFFFLYHLLSFQNDTKKIYSYFFFNFWILNYYSFFY